MPAEPCDAVCPLEKIEEIVIRGFDYVVAIIMYYILYSLAAGFGLAETIPMYLIYLIWVGLQVIVAILVACHKMQALWGAFFGHWLTTILYKLI